MSSWRLPRMVVEQMIPFDPATLLAIFGPAAVDLVKTLVQRIAPTEFKPATIEQYQTMRQMDLELFKAMNASGASYPWVEAVRSLMRPVVCLGVTAAFIWDGGQSQALANAAATVWFYLFGERTMFKAKAAAK